MTHYGPSASARLSRSVDRTSRAMSALEAGFARLGAAYRAWYERLSPEERAEWDRIAWPNEDPPCP